ELPATVNAAINRKIEQYYLVQEYAFRVEREKKESERKQIEAYGIRDFQQTVTQGISDSYVRWRGIEATLQLAQSPNTKIVIIGSGKDGLPVILGNVDTPVQPNPATPGTTPAPPAGGAVSDNSEAAKQRPSAASPPLLEKTPASNLPSPSERASPTAVPRASSDKPPGADTEGTVATTDDATATKPAPQSATPAAEPRTSWTWSELQELISRTVGAGGPPAGPEPRSPMSGPTPRQAAGEPPHPPAGPPPPPPRPPERAPPPPRPPDAPR
ncbi:MAG TPA: hypothetical protein VFE13_09175, partial [Caulobacteraceae bacterium]|nr:hypothetical protein [Caulobacteraceae bacterium]